MQAPANINIPALYAGDTAIISWDAVDGATGYILERRFDATFDGLMFNWDEYEQRFPSWDAFEAESPTWNEQDALEPSFAIYTGPDTQHPDNIPFGAVTAIYRVRAFADSEYSPWAVSPVVEISVEPRPPVIDGEDRDIGTRYKGFAVVFEAYDPDENSAVNVTAVLDGEQIAEWLDITQRTPHEVEITDEQVWAMEEGSTHTITIVATDDIGLTATRVYTFRAVEDLVTTATLYILRDDVPVAKLASVSEWVDYMAVGTHKYIVRAVDKYDNYVDSNAVTVTTEIEHATLALTASPSAYFEAKMRRDERPRKSQEYSIPADETYFEGRAYPVYSIGVQRAKKQEITFTTRTMAEWNALFELIRRGEPVIYRDLYDTRIIGFIPQFSPEFMQRQRYRPDFEAIIDHTLTINQIDYSEVVAYD